ncbi:MAG: alanine--tRNA ligase [Peptococcaceae bacterium]|nr:alanine--tRNA ligase [Peptococcaceae bacterium]
MKASEIRQLFLDFFQSKNHRVLPSASLIPANDPSILWTAAGMVPFKPYFTGAAIPEFKRVTTCQKCLRTPDIESVGRTARHHTFFEMLGNFSFGDYFKESAIPWAWEFVTKYLKLDPARLWISIYLDDDEAFEYWRSLGISADRIVRLGKDDNFWEIGVGPCGPCSEIHYDLGPERGCGKPDCAPGCDCDRYLEIWNLVFIQYYRDEEGNYSELTKKGIDTGMGLERVAAVLQNVPTNFDTDIFRDIIDYAAQILKVEYGKDKETDLALKVIADHTRAITFAIGDGVLPSNEGRGYVIRRLLRRAVRFGLLCGQEDVFLHKVAHKVVEKMEDAYPELRSQEGNISSVIAHEEARFRETIKQGTAILDRLMEEAIASGTRVLSGNDAFRLYDTYGFPLELTKEICAENNIAVDEEEFARFMERQRKRARQARQETEYLSEKDALFQQVREQVGETLFVGYESITAEATVQAIISEREQVSGANAGDEVDVIFDRTPCYAESGGQVSDSAIIEGKEVTGRVTHVFKPVENLFAHRIKIEQGRLQTGMQVSLSVDAFKRKNTCRNHTATHIIHKVLRDVLGEHVRQAGSLVTPDRLRFDFTHFKPVSKAELARIEERANEIILSNYPVRAFITSYSEAKQMGAIALFGEKYGHKVRVVEIDNWSRELCGGTHVSSTAEIALLKITSEGSVGAGTRRIEALTGPAALEYLSQRSDQVTQVANLLKSTENEIVPRLESMINNVKHLSSEVEKLKDRLQAFEVKELINNARTYDGVNILVAPVKASDMSELRGLVDLLRDKLGSSVIILGSANADKVSLVAAVSKDLTSKGLHAGKIIKNVAAVVGGGGGGRPEMAQAGGKDPARLHEALDKGFKTITGILENGTE